MSSCEVEKGCLVWNFLFWAQAANRLAVFTQGRSSIFE